MTTSTSAIALPVPAAPAAPAGAAPLRPVQALVGAIALAGGLGTFLLMPDSIERSLAVLDRGDPAAIAALLDNATVPPPSAGQVLPLVQLALELGDPDRAAAIVRAYLAEHPDEIAALRLQAGLLEQARRWGELSRVQERLHQITGEIEPLRLAAELHTAPAEAPRRLALLDRLAALGAATPEEVTELALGRAAAGEAAAALAAGMRELARDVIGSEHGNLAALMARLLPGQAEAVSQARRLGLLLGAAEQRMMIRAVGAALLGQGWPDLARLAFDGYAAASPDQVGAEQVLAEIAFGLGWPAMALERLAAAQEAAPAGLPVPGARLLAELALAAGRLPLAFEAASGLVGDAMPAGLPLRLLDAAEAAGMAALLLRAFPPGALAMEPAAEAVAALARGDQAQAAGMAMAALEQPPALYHAGQALLGALRALRLEEVALDRLEARLEDGPPDAGSLRLLLALAAAPERAARALPLLERLRDVSPEAGGAWVALAAGQGQGKAAVAWLSAGGRAEPGGLLQAYFTGTGRRDAALAAAAAEALRAHDEARLPTGWTQAELELTAASLAGPLSPTQLREALDVMAVPRADAAARTRLAWLLAGARAPGMAALGASAGEHPAVALLLQDLAAREAAGDREGAPLLPVLAAIAPGRAVPLLAPRAAADPAAHGATLVGALLASGAEAAAVAEFRGLLRRLPAGGRDALAHRVVALAPAGSGTRLDLLRVASGEIGGAWHWALEAELQRTGRREELLALLRSRAAQPGLPARDRLALAARLREMGDRTGALAVMRTMAERQPPQSEAVRGLVYAWGPRAAPEAVAWTRARALAAPPDELGGWLRHLDYLAAPRAVAEVVEARAERLAADATLAEPYAWALRRLGEPGRARPVLEQALAASSDPAALVALGRAAQAVAQPMLALRAFAQAVAQRPDSAELRLLAARAASWARRPAEAAPHYEALLALRPQPVEVQIEAGQTLLALDRRREARRLLRGALEQLAATGPGGPEGDRLRARALHGLGEHAAARALLQEAAARRPRDTALRAELLQVEVSLAAARRP